MILALILGVILSIIFFGVIETACLIFIVFAVLTAIGFYLQETGRG